MLRKARFDDYDVFKKLQTERYYGEGTGSEAMIDAIWQMKNTGDIAIFTIEPEDGKEGKTDSGDWDKGPVGFIVIGSPNGPIPNVGIDILDEFQNRGYATDAIRELKYEDYIFETEKDNAPANRVAEKLGLELAGREEIEGYEFNIWHLKEQKNI